MSDFEKQLLVSINDVILALAGEPGVNKAGTILDVLRDLNVTISDDGEASIAALLENIILALSLTGRIIEARGQYLATEARNVATSIDGLAEAVNTFSIPDPTSAMMAAAEGIQSELARIGDLLADRLPVLSAPVSGINERPVTVDVFRNDHGRTECRRCGLEAHNPTVQEFEIAPGMIERAVTAEQTKDVGTACVGCNKPDPPPPAVVKVRQDGSRFYRADNGCLLFEFGIGDKSLPDAEIARDQFLIACERDSTVGRVEFV